MIMLMKFESFKTKLSISEITNHINYKWNPNDPQIYRSHEFTDEPSQDIFIYHMESDRKLKGSMSRIIDSLPSWDKFTNRKRSLVATNSYQYADEWGTKINSGTYITLPIKNEIFISPSADFNLNLPKSGFPKFEELFGEMTSSSVGQYIQLEILDLHNLIPQKWMSIDDSMENFLKEDIFNKIVDELIKVVKRNKGNTSKLPSGFRNIKGNKIDRYRRILKFIKDNNINSGLEFLDSLLNPIDNGFEKMKYTEYIDKLKSNSELNNYPGNEVWFMSDCILIDIDTFPNILN